MKRKTKIALPDPEMMLIFNDIVLFMEDNDLESIEELMEDYDIRFDNEILLRKAVEMNSLLYVKLFVEKYKASIYVNKCYPVRQAIMNGNLNMVKFLVEKGSPLEIAPYDHRFVDFDSDSSNEDEYAQCRPLVIAICRQQIEIVQFLLQNKASVYANDNLALRAICDTQTLILIGQHFGREVIEKHLPIMSNLGKIGKKELKMAFDKIELMKILKEVA